MYPYTSNMCFLHSNDHEHLFMFAGHFGFLFYELSVLLKKNSSCLFLLRSVNSSHILVSSTVLVNDL